MRVALHYDSCTEMLKRVWRYQRGNKNPWRRTDNTMAKRKKTKDLHILV